MKPTGLVPGLPNMQQTHSSNLAAFNATKKNFPQLNKLTTHKKSYISPYSLKNIQKT